MSAGCNSPNLGLYIRDSNQGSGNLESRIPRIVQSSFKPTGGVRQSHSPMVGRNENFLTVNNSDPRIIERKSQNLSDLVGGGFIEIPMKSQFCEGRPKSSFYKAELKD